MMPFFSVIIPVFDRAGTLPATLDSVNSQRFTDFEIIVVDDGSTDGSVAVAQAYPADIKIIEQKNRGPGAARNVGIEHARGKYVCFLDSDDVWFPWTLKVFFQAIQSEGNPAFLTGKDVRFHSDEPPRILEMKEVKLRYFQNYYSTSRDDVWIGTCAACIEKTALQKVGGFAERNINGEDSDLWLKLGVERGFVIIESPEVFGYRMHSGSAIGSIDKTLAGAFYMINQEMTNGYPGGKTHQVSRWRILARHLRPVVLACLKEGKPRIGLSLYWKTFFWNLRLFRWKFLFGFWIHFLLTLCNRERWLSND
jgi:glycosyltransferase involved in cell wall biosynthesis